MNISELISELSSLGINLKAENGELIVNAPKDVMTPELRDQIVEHRVRLLSIVGAHELSSLKGGSPIEALIDTADKPLSFAQERLWFVAYMKAESDARTNATNRPLYTIQVPVRMRGVLNVNVLKAALHEVIRRHETLRSVFVEVDGKPLQRVISDAQIEVTEVDLSSFPATGQNTLVEKHIAQDAGKGFDLVAGLPCRAELMHLSDDEHVLLFSVHHIAFDGWSVNTLFREIDVLYRAFIDNKPSPLPELTIQYADFAVWQRKHLDAGSFDQQVEYWRTRLRGMETLQLPIHRVRPAVQSFSGALCKREMSGELLRGLRRLGKREAATLFTTLLTGFVALLHRYSGQEDIVLGTAVSTRTHQELEHLIGFLVNMQVLRTDVAGNPTFTELLGRVHETVLTAYENQEVPFEKIVEALEPERDLSRNPLFQASFTLQSTAQTSLSLGDLDLEVIPAKVSSTRLDLECQAVERRDGLTVRLVYNMELFEKPIIERMLDHFENLLEHMSVHPDARIDSVELISTADRKKLIEQSMGTVCSFPSQYSMIDLFEEQVKRYPDLPAAVFNGRELSYRQLDVCSSRFAHFIRRHGVRRGSRVGLCVERGLGFVIGLLGIWKTGAVYLPLDPEYPDTRLQFMLDDAGVHHVVTEAKLVKRLRSFDADSVLLEFDNPDVDACNDQELPDSPGSDDIAYLIYTSGSTGTPKGVEVPHRGLCNVSSEQVRAFGVGPGDRVLQFSSPSFDAAAFDVVMSIASGATLVLAQMERLQPGAPLASLLRDENISILTIPPSALSVVPRAELPQLRVINVAGEACPAQLVKHWLRAGRRFFNLYGPTEATIWSTMAECKADGLAPGIGRPIGNVGTYVLDARGNLLPPGLTGELHIAGVGVAAGYLGKPELSAARFIPDPFSATSGMRMYRTGDLVRWRDDNELEFIGRVDVQVKVRGFRIELGEIEAALNEHPGIREAVVVCREDAPGDRRLYAYTVPEVDAVLTFSVLRSYLRSRLPAYMMPSRFVELAELPLTTNGKLDREALPASEGERQAEHAYVAPVTATERRVAAIWGELLGVEMVGVHDSFFELGGNSLLVIQMRRLLEQEFDIELAIVDFFDHPTVHELGRYCSVQHEAVADGVVPSSLTKIKERAHKRRAAMHRRGRDVIEGPAR